MGYENESYRQLYSAPYHIGKPVREDIKEYLRRSPYSHAAELQTPLLIHTNTNDEDVNVLEVPHLIDSLKLPERSSSTRFTKTPRAATISIAPIPRWRKNHGAKCTGSWTATCIRPVPSNDLWGSP